MAMGQFQKGVVKQIRWDDVAMRESEDCAATQEFDEGGIGAVFLERVEGQTPSKLEE